MVNPSPTNVPRTPTNERGHGHTRGPSGAGATGPEGETADRVSVGDLVVPADTASARSTAAREIPPGFYEDFRRFFLRGLSALLPTLITLWLLVWVWNFLWESLGVHLIYAIKWVWSLLGEWGLLKFKPVTNIQWDWRRNVSPWQEQLIGVGLAILLVYIVGLFVGNLIGRTIWRLAEMAVMRIPLVRAIYPAVKQVTDFVLAERKQPFVSGRVVAVQPHAGGIWSVGLVTGSGLGPLTEAVGEEMVTVFVPSSPTAFSGYVLVVPREAVVELPLTVEEAMRLLISGGVVTPKQVAGKQAADPGPAAAAPVAAAAAAASLQEPPPRSREPRQPVAEPVPGT